MKVEVLLFASLADRAGTASVTLEVPPGTKVSGLWDALGLRFPGLRAHGGRPLAACDLAYASWEHPLDDVREVAFLPPVSGG